MGISWPAWLLPPPGSSAVPVLAAAPEGPCAQKRTQSARAGPCRRGGGAAHARQASIRLAQPFQAADTRGTTWGRPLQGRCTPDVDGRPRQSPGPGAAIWAGRSAAGRPRQSQRPASRPSSACEVPLPALPLPLPRHIKVELETTRTLGRPAAVAGAKHGAPPAPVGEVGHSWLAPAERGHAPGPQVGGGAVDRLGQHLLCGGGGGGGWGAQGCVVDRAEGWPASSLPSCRMLTPSGMLGGHRCVNSTGQKAGSCSGASGWGCQTLQPASAGKQRAGAVLGRHACQVSTTGRTRRFWAGPRCKVRIPGAAGCDFTSTAGPPFNGKCSKAAG